MKITVFTTKSCAYCPMVKKYLKNKNREFDVVDVTDNMEKRIELQKLTGYTTVPITQLEENGTSKFIVGFQPGLLAQALA